MEREVSHEAKEELKKIEEDIKKKIAWKVRTELALMKKVDLSILKQGKAIKKVKSKQRIQATAKAILAKVLASLGLSYREIRDLLDISLGSITYYINDKKGVSSVANEIAKKILEDEEGYWAELRERIVKLIKK